LVGRELNKDEQDQLKMWVQWQICKSAGIPVILTSSLESESQGLLLEFKEILPEEYAARIQRTGVINAWDDPKFVAAIKATGKKTSLWVV
jgi:nicotinamidase-related amidase